jgi:Putative beta-barrel porin-2, OmpL-like. bbp2
LTGILWLVAALPLAAQEPIPSPTPEPRKIDVNGFVDTYFAYNGNRPADHTNFFPGVGTSAKRHDEASINLAQLDVALQANPVGFHLAVGFGTATEVVHAVEPAGPLVGPAVWEHVVQASVIYKATSKLVFEGGVYPSHIGFEGLATKDNWNYTRSWMGELSPYYQAGLKTTYAFDDAWSAQIHLLNGWQNIGDNNDGKAVGTQVAYNKGKLSASFNTFVGPELPNDDHDYRMLGDLVLTYRASPDWSLGGALDLAREGRPQGPAARWSGGALYLRWAPPRSRTALALRGEYYDDKDGAISGTPQTLREFTATLERRPAPPLILRLEGRYDRSSAGVFAGDRVGRDGQPLRRRSQFVLLLGAVASF